MCFWVLSLPRNTRGANPTLIIVARQLFIVQRFQQNL